MLRLLPVRGQSRAGSPDFLGSPQRAPGSGEGVKALSSAWGPGELPGTLNVAGGGGVTDLFVLELTGLDRILEKP